ncbi:phenylalanine--tRNA ligase subunit beta [Pyrococcus furiosus DSM 3638]|uniref:Phenylalanine--tRNA ligase beta subunit n=3 Tax=Pyrococcus furiosus TaxID=2261 RepID=SYFB_PYRFU|nr:MULTISPECIES: phenylalanine--tRNA ligase subunit beta [Pyrococcus]Q8U260.1 RecName: Full=Phenylalanine--tRNA ligase beta subunit; AltName: Full=Phenylalanyl-tRNA synthetase beta subunit; Short=PheRS [Pyrococcus furiosus DSM 3638]AAL81114.1 phenylalanyl-tRNA synthetase beta-chain [Pyrococcus furiosus DSM 3638]AFN03785.1 phenylalanyl-tRNA ligase subunit beta [Pyrococcus furiosus COM1]MDK2869843.1 phenylalanyl-tRNA synthetase beta chain [Pyrococcus sp.]QEK78655.1 phenylalanine--tRNA ligase sub
MPKFDVAKSDLERLVGREFSVEEWEDLVLYAKCELDDVWEEDGKIYFKLDSKDTNRPDLWSAEGVARQIRWALGLAKGLPKYEVEESDVVVYVDKKLRNIRPYGVYAVVEGLKLDEEALSQLIQLQEKVALTYGRRRREVAIGIFDFDKVKPPIYYRAAEKTEKFVPLGYSEEMTLEEILEKHEKGREYGHLIRDKPYYPLLVDSEGNVLSMPPIINSELTGRVTTETKNVFVDVTGWDLRKVMLALNVIVTALAERGGKIKRVKVIYPDFEITTPDLTPKEFEVSFEYIRKLSGLELSNEEIKELLERMMYEVEILSENKAKVKYPAFRDDIMHTRDVLEDVLIAYGYNNIDPEEPKLAVQGRGDPFKDFEDAIRDLMVGFGLQEVMTFNLTSKEVQFDKMNIPEEEIVEIANPISSRWSALRKWLLPSLMEFLSNNTHEEYPQRIFEVGLATLIDESRETKTVSEPKLAVALAGSGYTFTNAKEILDSLMRHLGIEYDIEETVHGSFIPGRVGKILVDGKEIGIIGEIHPQVLENWNIQVPVVAFEIFLKPLYR